MTREIIEITRYKCDFCDDIILEVSSEDKNSRSDRTPQISYAGFGSSRFPPKIIGEDGIRIKEVDEDGREITEIGDVYFCSEHCKLEYAKKFKVTSFDIAY